MTFPAHQLAIFDIGGPEVLLVLLLVLLLFGGKQLPELARGLGKSVREFKKATAGVEDEIKKAIHAPAEPSQPPPAKPMVTPPAAPPPSARPSNPFLAPPPPPGKPDGI